MAWRAILPFVLATVLFAGMARADDSAGLPSSKASVVLPLLRKLSTTPKLTLEEVEKILGPSRTHITVGSAGGLTSYYTLDDKTQVGVQFYDRPDHELICIWAMAPGEKWNFSTGVPPK